MDTNADARTTDPDAKKLWSLIRDVKFAMLTTEDGDVLRSRPMAAVDRDFEGGLWFFTRASSHKVEEIGEDRRVNLSYADPSSQTYVSLSGRAALVRDAAEIAARWTESLRTWFPNGRDDPDTALLRVRIDQAEYWDVPSSTMVHVYGYVKAALTGKSPVPGDHATLDLRGAASSTAM